MRLPRASRTQSRYESGSRVPTPKTMRRHLAGDEDRARETNANPDRHHPDTLTHDQRDDIRLPRAQRDAHADLRNPFGDRFGEHAVVPITASPRPRNENMPIRRSVNLRGAVARSISACSGMTSGNGFSGLTRRTIVLIAGTRVCGSRSVPISILPSVM